MQITTYFSKRVLEQLCDVHEKWEAASNIIQDYQVAVQKCMTLEIRISQLSKENGSLCDENSYKDAAIAHLTDQVKTAQEDIRKQLVVVRSEKEALVKHKEADEDRLRIMAEECRATKDRVTQLETENGELLKNLISEKEVREVAVSELHAWRKEAEILGEKLKEAENENRRFFNKIIEDQEVFSSKLQEITELEDQAHNTKREIERMHEQMTQQMEVGLSSFWKRKRNPFSKRMIVYAQMIERGDMDKALQALDVMILEMKDYRRTPDMTRSMTVPIERLGNALMEVEDTPKIEDGKEWSSFRVEIPTVPHEMESRHHGGCTCCTVTKSGTLCATGGFDRQVTIWDPSRQTVYAVLKGMADSVRDVSFTSSGDAILAAGADKSVRVWNTSSWDVKKVMTGHSKSINCVYCDPCNDNRALSCGDDRCILFWDIGQGYRIQKYDIHLEEWATSVCFNSVGMVISGHSKGFLKLWDMRSPSAAIDGHSGIHSEAIVALRPLPNSSHQLLTAGKDNKLALFDFRKNEIVRTFSDPQFSIGTVSYMGKGKTSIDISSDERLIVAGSNSGRVMIWHKTEAKPDRYTYALELPSSTDAITAITWAADSIFVCDRAGRSVIWTPQHRF